MTAAGVEGPFAVGPDDIPQLNEVFSDAFTERYRRDGMVGVRVPALNPAIWRFSLSDADRGAMVWRDAAGDVANADTRKFLAGWMQKYLAWVERFGS